MTLMTFKKDGEFVIDGVNAIILSKHWEPAVVKMQPTVEPQHEIKCVNIKNINFLGVPVGLLNKLYFLWGVAKWIFGPSRVQE